MIQYTGKPIDSGLDIFSRETGEQPFKKNLCIVPVHVWYLEHQNRLRRPPDSKQPILLLTLLPQIAIVLHRSKGSVTIIQA